MSIILYLYTSEYLWFETSKHKAKKVLKLEHFSNFLVSDDGAKINYDFDTEKF
jgi:hypothetical protein